MKPGFKAVKKPQGNPYKMGEPQVGINLQPDGFKVRPKSHKRF